MKTALKFVALVATAHAVTYLISGIVGQRLLGLHDFYPPSQHALSYLRDPLSAHVQTWVWPAQLTRGVLFGLVLLPFRSRIGALGQLRGGLAVTSLLFVVSYLAAAGGLIEHLVFFSEYPFRFAALTAVEIVLHTAMLGQWIAWREAKSLSRGAEPRLAVRST
ncbi:MAG TPA: hypothetical protein VLM85_15970 [Polyangiaceae bacterium]|nr:hypothetical protein [Polyangiaceae bacterium]